MENQLILRIDRLRELRERLGWSQRELARRCGLGESFINRYESGISDPSAANIKLIAEALGISADYLLGLSDEPRGQMGDGQLTDDERAVLDAYRRSGWAGLARLLAEALEK